VRRLGIVAGLVGFLAAALFLTRPLVGQLASAIPASLEADVEHQLWAQWWFGRALATGHPLFHTDVIHFPQQVDLSLADLNLALLADFWLVERVAGTLLTWNLLLLASCVLAGAGLWPLALRASGRRDAAWLAALCFAASAYWRACAANAWLYLAQGFVLPLALLAGARALRTRRRADAALVALAVALAFHLTPIYFLFLLLLAAVLAPWHAERVRAWVVGAGGAQRVAVFAGVLALLVLPRAWGMLRASQTLLVVHSSPFDSHLAARALELVSPWTSAVEASPRWGFRGAYLGAVPLALAAFAFARGDAAQRRRLAPWLGGALVFAVLALGPYAEVGGARVPLPFWALAQLPGFSQLTNPWRFALPSLLCLALPAGAGAAALARAADVRARGAGAALVIALGVVHVLEIGNAPPFPARMALWRDRPAPIATALRDDAELRAVLDLSRHPKRNQRTHGKAIVSGWLPRVAVRVVDETEQLVERVRAAPPGARADRLGASGIGAVIVDDTRGWRIRPDPERPGRFVEERIELRDAAAAR
jgi:hypothetical protein